MDNTGYSSLISNAQKLKKYILITMDYCNRRLLLPLEDDGLTVDDIILEEAVLREIGVYIIKRQNKIPPATSPTSYPS